MGVNSNPARELFLLQGTGLGAVHKRSGTGCQDSVAAVRADGLLFLALSDGAGSAERAGQGSGLVVGTATHVLRSVSWNQTPPTNRWLQSLAAHLVSQVQSAIARVAATATNGELAPYHATMLAAVVHAEWAALFQLGDGCLIHRLLRGTEYTVAPPQSKADYANLTHFVTEDSARQWLSLAVVPEPLSFLLMSSDGLEGVLLKDGRPRPQAIAYWERVLEQARAEGLGNEELDELLTVQEPFSLPHFADDKSLILVGLSGPAGNSTASSRKNG